MARVRLSVEGIQQELAQMSRNSERARQRLAEWQDERVTCTPSVPVATWGKARLLYHEGSRRGAGGPPLLIIYSLVNRPYVLDLCPGSSLIGELVARGIDTYLIDWGTPGREDAGLGLAAYVVDALDTMRGCVQQRHAGTSPVLLGVCQGGTLALCHALLRPADVRSLVTLVTPVDFHTSDDQFSRQLRALDVDSFVELTGNVPADVLDALFLAQKPARTLIGKYVDFVSHADDAAACARFLALERWLFDGPPLAGTMAREFVETFYRRNVLAQGGLDIAGHRLTLSALRQPVLNIWARDDHLVPPAAARALSVLAPSADYTGMEIESGHIGALMSPRQVPRIADAIAGWIAHPGTPPVGAAGT